MDGPAIVAAKLACVLGYPLIIIAYDAWLKASGHLTISTDVQEAAKRRPIVAFAFGGVFLGLAVHFFPF